MICRISYVAILVSIGFKKKVSVDNKLHYITFHYTEEAKS